VTRNGSWGWLPPLLLAPVLGVMSLVLPVWIHGLPGEPTSPLFPILASGIEHMSALTLLLLFLSGAILGGAFRHPASWVASIAVMAAMPVVIVADVLVDPTSHNLFPVELVIYGVLSVLALVGALVAAKVRRILRRSPPG
jgi:hypothetical protein